MKLVVAFGTLKNNTHNRFNRKSSLKKLVKLATGNVMQTLSGKVGGVNHHKFLVNKGDAPQIRFRGLVHYLLQTTPLYVVDGMPLVKDLIR